MRFARDRVQVTFILKALRINFVDVLGAGGPGCEPASISYDLQPADRGAVTWGGGQFGSDLLAGEDIRGHCFGRQLLQPRLLLWRRRRIDARVVSRTELGC